MKYNLFLFDLDDTLFDFKSSEKKSLLDTLKYFGVNKNQEEIYQTYKDESEKLWRLLEQKKATKEFLRVERFRKTISKHRINSCPVKMSEKYLEVLPETVILNNYAEEVCKFLSSHGEVGIITNGIESVQKQRLKNSKIKDYISFMAVSEKCGYAKPDIRFFEYAIKLTKEFSKEKALVIGDRIETDVKGAHKFGLDACWYNPNGRPLNNEIKPKYQISNLYELRDIASIQ